MLVLDAHAHCGLTLPYKEITDRWREGDIHGGVLFAPVEEIYDRYNPLFTDSPAYRESRARVHDYLESLAAEQVFIYWFVWNDFAPPRDAFAGIKWHRHADEPEYNYADPRCAEFIEHVCSRRMPVIIEEEFHQTLELVNRIDGRTVVIIPHFGMLNGGYRRLKRAGLFDNQAVYVDTALAGLDEMADFAADYGVDRILFGSDFPFGSPARERYRAERVFTGRTREKILAENLLALLNNNPPNSG